VALEHGSEANRERNDAEGMPHAVQDLISELADGKVPKHLIKVVTV
jgi:hypothetical protein